MGKLKIKIRAEIDEMEMNKKIHKESIKQSQIFENVDTLTNAQLV